MNNNDIKSRCQTLGKKSKLHNTCNTMQLLTLNVNMKLEEKSLKFVLMKIKRVMKIVEEKMTSDIMRKLLS